MDEIINMPQVEEGDLVVKFSKPFVFENKTYTEVDLRGLEDLNGEDLCRADRAVRAQGNTAPMTEMTPDMACFLSSASAHLPVEFFKVSYFPHSLQLSICCISAVSFIGAQYVSLSSV